MATAYYIMKMSQSSEKSIDFYHYFENMLKKTLHGTENKYLCRICLKEGSHLIDNIGISLLETLKLFCVIETNEFNYHNHLCNVCIEFLKAACLFRNLAERSEEILKQTVKPDDLDISFDNDNEHSNDLVDSKLPVTEWKAIESLEELEHKEKIKYPAKVTCKICNKVVSGAYFKVHMTMHDPDHEKYICDICGKSFRLRCAYRNHSLRHQEDFSYKCSLCPYRGRYKELLNNHMRTHSGDYRYMCTECPARFLFKSNLNSHIIKHKEPQFKCDTCNRAFHTRITLQKHTDADHLGIKNHVCNLCGKAFGYRNAMMKHQRNVHKREKMMSGRMPSYLKIQKVNI